MGNGWCFRFGVLVEETVGWGGGCRERQRGKGRVRTVRKREREKKKLLSVGRSC